MHRLSIHARTVVIYTINASIIHPRAYRGRDSIVSRPRFIDHDLSTTAQVNELRTRYNRVPTFIVPQAEQAMSGRDNDGTPTPDALGVKRGRTIVV